MDMKQEIRTELTEHIIPFWKSLRDDTYGGYYGYLDYDLHLDKEAVKGCILNSRIMWFFSNAAMILDDKSLLDEAGHAYEFLKTRFLDPVHGGVYWSVRYDGTPEETMKHTYSNSFAIYALSSYYDATGDHEALDIALSLFRVIEAHMRDKDGYLEAFDRDYSPVKNEALSENGVMATRTMNTILHVMEAYTELYRVSKDPDVRERLVEILGVMKEKIWNPEKKRQEVFFDRDYHSLIDLYSYGHDIESSWLIDLTVSVLENPNQGPLEVHFGGESDMAKAMNLITADMREQVLRLAFDGRSIPVECEKGVVKQDRVWWVQCEGINGYVSGYLKDRTKTDYLAAAEKLWNFTKTYVVDSRPGSEWFWYTDENGVPAHDPIVEPWKYPYHNGRMCLLVLNNL